MFLYENEKCPVCDKPFEEKDDVVVCPKCATPHHRECYNELGHCANKDKHKDGFVYEKAQAEYTHIHSEDNSEAVSSSAEIVSEVQETPEVEQNSVQNVQYDSSELTVCESCGTEIQKSAPFCHHCGARNTDWQNQNTGNVVNDFFYNDNGETIDGVRVRDAARFVKSNVQRFVDKFRENKKVGWNWGAFFFGPYYLFFRKMTKQGVFALLVDMIVTIFVNGAYVVQFDKYSKLREEIFAIVGNDMQNLSKISNELMQQLVDATYSLLPAFVIMLSCKVVMNVVIALISDNLYRTKVLTTIKKFDNKNDVQTIGLSISVGHPVEFNSEQLRRTYLNRAGGVSFFSPIFAYCLLSLAMSLIAKISL